MSYRWKRTLAAAAACAVILSAWAGAEELSVDLAEPALAVEAPLAQVAEEAESEEIEIPVEELGEMNLGGEAGEDEAAEEASGEEAKPAEDEAEQVEETGAAEAAVVEEASFGAGYIAVEAGQTVYADAGLSRALGSFRESAYAYATNAGGGVLRVVFDTQERRDQRKGLAAGYLRLSDVYVMDEGESAGLTNAMMGDQTLRSFGDGQVCAPLAKFRFSAGALSATGDAALDQPGWVFPDRAFSGYLEAYSDAIRNMFQPSRRVYPGKLVWPLEGCAPLSGVTSHVGWRDAYAIWQRQGGTSPSWVHHGVDVGTGGGKPLVRAAASGRAWAWDLGDGSGCGRMVVVDHGNGWYTEYQHLSRFAGGLKDGSAGVEVAAGDPVGYVGSSGGDYPVHFHFEIAYAPDGAGHASEYLRQTTNREVYAYCRPMGDLVRMRWPRTWEMCSAEYQQFVREPEDVNPVREITLDLEEVWLNSLTGDSVDLEAAIVPADAADPTLDWNTSDAGVARVNRFGRVSAMAPGEATITCEAADGRGAKAQCRVGVIEFSAEPDRLVCAVGQLTVLRGMADGSPVDCVFVSSDPSVVSVNRRTGRLTARRPGSAAITVTAPSGVSARCDITVTAGEEPGQAQ